MPSISTPAFMPSIGNTSSSSSSNSSSRSGRRHTVVERPDSAIALLSEDEVDENNQHLEPFDRISDILSKLIREANDAVNGIEKEKAQLQKARLARAAALSSRPSHANSLPTRPSRLPRPVKTRSFNLNSTASDLSSSSLSSMRLFSPSPTTTTRSNSDLLPPPTLTSSSSGRPLSCPTLASNKRILHEPLLESFKRLNSSMALVDSLSRDLANQSSETTEGTHSSTSTSSLSLLFLVPLLHIPHALITVIFDTLNSSSTSRSSFNLSGMIAWACLFALGNLMVNDVVSSNGLQQRRTSLPGAYNNSSSNSNNLAGREVKQQEKETQGETERQSDTNRPTTNPPEIQQLQQSRSTARKKRNVYRRSTTYRKRQSHTSRGHARQVSHTQLASNPTAVNAACPLPNGALLRRRNSVP